MGRLLSGRVGVTSYAGLSTHRNQTNGFPSFLSLEEAEPNLGLPGNNEFILYANTNGERFWAAPPSGSGGGSAFGFTVQDQGTTPVGFAGSTTTLNFSGNGVSVIEAKENIGVGGTIQVGISTVLIQKNQLDFEDANDFTRNTGITTIRVGMGLSFMAIPAGDNTSGIASIFSVADSSIKFEDATGFEIVDDINVIRLGIGLTLSQPSVGIASIAPTGIVEHLSVSGIASAPIFDGNLTGNVTGNITGNVTGNVTGNISSSSGNVEVDPATQILEVKGDGSSIEGQIQLNCHVNSHGQKITAADHSVGASNKLTLPGGSTIGNSDATLVSDTGTQTLTNKTLTSPTITGTGAIAGIFAGDLTGNTSGIHTGAVDGNVTGNLTGNVTSTGTNSLHTLSGVSATFSSFVGDLTGPATQIAVSNDASDTTNNILFVNTATGDQVAKSNSALTFNAATGTFSATSLSGTLASTNLSGALPALDGSNLTDVVTSLIDITATNTTSADHFITFVDTAGGSGETLRSDTDLIYNPGTNTLTATNFNGSCTGLTGDPDVTVTNITLKGNIIPDVNGIRSLGSDAVRFSNIYTSDMHFSNVNYGGNDVDGTSGSWTLQEGDENIFMINNVTKKKYKISLTEV